MPLVGVTLAVCAVPKLFDHEYVTPVAGNAVSVAVGLVQFTVAKSAEALAAGAALSAVTFTVAVAVQPLLMLVTVTV